MRGKLYRHFGRGVRFSVDIGHPENRTSQYRYRAKNNAIYYNDDLEEIVLSENITKLGEYSLASNRKLKSLAIPAGVTEIPQSCFASDEGLTSITFASDFTSIGNGAFTKPVWPK